MKFVLRVIDGQYIMMAGFNRQFTIDYKRASRFSYGEAFREKNFLRGRIDVEMISENELGVMEIMES